MNGQDYLTWIGVMIFTADLSSYGQPYPLLHDVNDTAIIISEAKITIFFEILVFMIFIIDNT